MTKLHDSERLGNRKLEALVQLATGQLLPPYRVKALVRRGLAVLELGTYELSEGGEGAILVLRSLAELHPTVAERHLAHVRKVF